MSIIFNKIENENIFSQESFNPFSRNNEISFPSSNSLEEIVVIYGPNGTGKTSLVKVLKEERGTKVKFSFDGVEYQSGKDVFHIINDQNSRNIIHGDTQDFILGDNIRREFELQRQLKTERELVINNIVSIVKNRFGISAANSQLVDLIEKPELAEFIKDCANSKSKGNRYSEEIIIELMNTLEHYDIDMEEYSTEKIDFLKKDFSTKTPIIKQIESLIEGTLTINSGVREIEKIQKPLIFFLVFRLTNVLYVIRKVLIEKDC